MAMAMMRILAIVLYVAVPMRACSMTSTHEGGPDVSWVDYDDNGLIKVGKHLVMELPEFLTGLAGKENSDTSSPDKELPETLILSYPGKHDQIFSQLDWSHLSARYASPED